MDSKSAVKLGVGLSDAQHCCTETVGQAIFLRWLSVMEMVISERYTSFRKRHGPLMHVSAWSLESPMHGTYLVTTIRACQNVIHMHCCSCRYVLRTPYLVHILPQRPGCKYWIPAFEVLLDSTYSGRPGVGPASNEKGCELKMPRRQSEQLLPYLPCKHLLQNTNICLYGVV